MRSILENKTSEKRKAQLGNLQGIILTLVVVGILLGAGFFIMEEFRDQAAEIADDGVNASSYQGINDTIDAMGTIPSLLSLIVLISIIGIILAVVFNVIPGARGSA